MTSSLPTALAGKQLVVVDIEGNGQKRPEIIEIAVLPVDGETGIEAMQEWLIKPIEPITGLVTRKVHGITNADVANCPKWTDVASAVSELLANRILVAHNASVEYRVLTVHLPDWQPPMVLDTLRLARHVWRHLGGYGLNRLVEHAELDTSAVANARYHRARYDAWCAWQLLLTLVERSGLDWVELVKVAALRDSTSLDEPSGGLW